MAVVDNNSQNRGVGKWKVQTYNPTALIGPIDGVLIVNKDFYTIFKDEKMVSCLFNVPIQNVAFAYNEFLVQDLIISK
jgi:hypothetical protein